MMIEGLMKKVQVRYRCDVAPSVCRLERSSGPNRMPLLPSASGFAPAAVARGPSGISSLPSKLLLCVLLLRLVQRAYYLLRGHRHHSFSYRPRAALESFLLSCHTHTSFHTFTTKHDGVPINYRRLGSGPKHVLLANGVGTDLHMWLATLRCMHQLYPELFDQVTFLVLSYRGLFEADDDVTADPGKPVDISISLCVKDVMELMVHAKVPQFHTIIGWSTGAQVALACCLQHPHCCRRIFLLNPSTGLTLHYAGQAVVHLPLALGRHVSNALHAILTSLIALIRSRPAVWGIIRRFVLSPVFRCILEGIAFFGGFPPEQPACFHEYMRDQFRTRRQTLHLLALILSLDEPPPAAGFSAITQDTVIVSGLPDILTGVYHSQQLARQIPRAKHVMFTMASHFLLIEWPDLLAKEILLQLMRE